MIKVNILNLTGFLDTINQCNGRVSMLAPTEQKSISPGSMASSMSLQSNTRRTERAYLSLCFLKSRKTIWLL